MTESVLARLFVVIKRPDGEPLLTEVDVPSLQARIEAAVRSWDDDFNDAAVGLASEDRGVEFSDAYEEEFPAAVAVQDLKLANRLGEADDAVYDLYSPTWETDQADLRFKVFRASPMSLTEVMPHLSVLGIEVIDERPYQWELRGRTIYLYDFGFTIPGGKQALGGWDPAAQQRFIEAFDASYRGKAESGRLNRLIMSAGLTWRQVSWLRGMSRYLQQAGVPFSQPYIAGALNENAPIAAALVRAFEIAFDPDLRYPADSDRHDSFQAALAGIEARLAEVASLDQDRILRMFVAVLRAMVRTNAFAGEVPALAFKLRPRELALLPEPRPMFEIFVYSPRVHGVHLRFGKVARGGLRWSDRKEDFRTEVLGLVKAQMVKNTVIVPVGAKGGFVPQRLADPAVDRAAWQAEGIACYQIFINALLTLTDNIVAGEVVPPAGVIRYDADDPYLVVAADKGTATFSDLANRISLERGHWLGDAFASGGSAGYDHKGMGITAKGAWESVKRHFVEMGRDCQAQDFTCVGIGDMAGDVFGNGMLLSEHTQLVAAFNHLHVFLDPDPDPALSFAERQRLFSLPRSTWADYDPVLISPGGGVFSRSLKAIPISPRVREVIGIDADVTSMTPAELIHALLQAPVDLLWNGGIGTYVKASTETHAEVGDKANDSVRVNGGEVRAQCAGEGGNLGWTQRGRVEYALRGGRVNTDFIDNSAGVDTSDHEVNIKILLADQIAAGRLGTQERNELLASMTDDVARLVLSHNVEQNLALANSMQRAADMAGAHEGWMQSLEAAGYLDRQLEYLPSSAEVAARIAEHRGLTRPELSTLLAYTKIYLKDLVLASSLPEDPYLADRLIQYFPRLLAERFATDMPRHRLAREIITTVAVNRFVNSQGITAYHRLSSETGASVSEVIRAQLAARSIFAVGRSEVSLSRGDLDAEVVTELRMALRRMVERVTRWLLANRKPPLDILGAIAQFTEGVAALRADLPQLVTSREHARASQARQRWMGLGVGEALAQELTHDSYAHFALTIVDIAQRLGIDLHRVADTYFRLSEALSLDLLLEAIISMSQLSKWDTMARAALRDDLLWVHGELTASVLAAADSDASATAVVEAWLARNPAVQGKAAILRQISEAPDVARLSVGVRMVRSLLM
ncbi:MAG: NAD-glutamate dehydrogenase [Micropruina sp.]|nr:NAD-glutamate dehydrogenase [Micropruina sp.]